jgi:hypothetical protein
MYIKNESLIHSQKKPFFVDGIIRIICLKYNRVLISKIIVSKFGSEHKY